MAGEKRFRNSIVGFNKSDVSAYMEKIIKEYGEQIRHRDEEITNLKARNDEIEKSLTALRETINEQIFNKEQIAGTLLKAQEMAEEIIKKAEEDAQVVKKQLEEQLEQDREKIVEAKSMLKELRKQTYEMAQNITAQINNIVEVEEVV